PGWEILQQVLDKRLTYRLAGTLGIDHPLTWCPANREEVASLDCAFPAILKPAYWASRNALNVAKAWRVEDRRELLERYDQACRLLPAEAIMVQELIPGGGEAQFSSAALCRDGVPLAEIVVRRARQYPPDFGHAS